MANDGTVATRWRKAIAARSLQLEDFLPVNLTNQNYPRIADLIRYYTIDKVLFRFTRDG